MSTQPLTTLNNGIKMPTIGLGVFESQPGNETYNAVLHSLKAGQRHIDTATLYRNEKSVGEAVRASGIPREQIFITTKVWTMNLGNSTNPVKSVTDSVANSLQALDMSQIDCILLHSPHHKHIRVELYKGLEQVLAEGKVRSIGVSNQGPHHIEELFRQTKVVPVCNQVEVHLFHQRKGLVDQCLGKGIAVVAQSPLAKARKMNDPVLVKMAKQYNKTPAQVMIKFIIQQGCVAIPKSVKNHRIEENFNVYDFTIENKHFEELKKLDIKYQSARWNPVEMD